jgi:RimJ/RimL family protein N-acetyltransferase
MPETKRLLLRNFENADAEILFRYRNDTRCNLYQRYEDTSVEYLREFVRRYAHSCFLSKEEEQHYAIVRRADRETVGDLSVFYSERDDCFTLGITVAPQFQRQGYALEMLNEVIARLQKEYPSSDMVALIEKNNAPSIGLFQKLGFAEECYAESIQSYVFTRSGKRSNLQGR